MALSQLARNYLTVALANKARAKEIADAIDAIHFASPASHVANAAAAAPVSIALSTANTYTDAAVNSAVNAALVSVIADINANQVKINAILSSLQTAGFML